MDTLGLYLHVPFCKSKCRYCDFCSFPHPREDRVRAYVDALCREIRSYRESENQYSLAAKKKTVNTVFFGGGTPSLLPADDFRRIMETLRDVFRIADGAEITVECNPATVNADYLKALRDLGINRLSIGAQSMQNGELRRLGRLHTADDVRQTVTDARTAGFDNVSLDLMFGIPEQTEKSFSDTLSAVIALSPEHLSVYGLQIEDGTYFAKHREELPLPDEDAERAMYLNAIETLAQNGIFQYEISNFAKDGFPSRHNLRYWKRLDYLGLGLAAHSCMGATRFSNTESLEEYLAGRWRDTVETVSPHDILCERIMLGMRLTEGVDFAELAERYGADVLAYRKKFARFADRGLVAIRQDRLFFTPSGLSVSNAILSDVLDFEG